MATIYAAQQVGVMDGTKVPADRADGRQVHAKKSVILASKVTGLAWAAADIIVLGKLNPGEKLVAVRLTTGTSLGTSTVSIGTVASPSKYVAAATLTVVDVPTPIGPKASTLDDDPLTAPETIVATIGTATIASGTVLTFELEIASIK